MDRCARRLYNPGMSDEEKNRAAQELVRRRWDNTPAKKRSEIARKMAKKRWDKEKGEKRK